MTRNLKLEYVMMLCTGGIIGLLLFPWHPLTPVALAFLFAGLLIAFGKRLER